MHMNLPKLKKDIYWDDSSARPPYTLAAADYCIPSFLGSTIEMGYVILKVPSTHGQKQFFTSPVYQIINTHSYEETPDLLWYTLEELSKILFSGYYISNYVENILNHDPRYHLF